MAITQADLQLWQYLKGSGILPRNPFVVEIGQANWYGDVSMIELAECVPAVKGWPEPATAGETFRIAAEVWKHFLSPKDIGAIDLHGGKLAWPHDLNRPLPASLYGRADVLINTGTLEHVFDQGAAWCNCHNLVKLGGLMAHNLPWIGWLDHGFYSYHPTFVSDLAEANGYELILLWYSELHPFRMVRLLGEGAEAEFTTGGGDGMLHAVYRKTHDGPFVVPMQKRYQRA